METTPNSRGAWMQTFTGKQFFPMDPRPEDISLSDIAHALSFSGRFNGHTKAFYSIAQHSYLVSKICPPEDALWVLMHDASEAYVGDMVQPVKVNFPQYEAMEKEVQKAIAAKFGLPPRIPRSVKVADLEMLATEARDLMAAPPPADWNLGVAPRSDVLIMPWEPHYAEAMFLDRFLELTSQLSG